jgi:hypothetical protein
MPASVPPRRQVQPPVAHAWRPSFVATAVYAGLFALVTLYLVAGDVEQLRGALLDGRPSGFVIGSALNALAFLLLLADGARALRGPVGVRRAQVVGAALCIALIFLVQLGLVAMRATALALG